MSNLRFNVNAKELAAEFGDLKEQLEADIKLSVQALASSTWAKTQELAATELKSSAGQYLKALSQPEEISDGVWVVSLDASMLWLEEGQSSFDMRETHLKKNYKTSKEGNRYKSIPFDHTKAPSDMTEKAKGLVDEIRAALKKEKIPFKKIEKNADGSPRTGKLHALNIASKRPTLNAKFPALHGLSIYQTEKPGGGIKRDIVTFRTISEKTAGDGSWIHPGTEARKLMDKAFEEAVSIWENQILPEMMGKYGK